MRTARRSILALLALVLLSGCATKHTWTRPVATAKQEARDEFECRLRSEEVRRPSGLRFWECLRGSWSFWNCQQAAFERCMESKGYRHVHERGWSIKLPDWLRIGLPGGA